MFTNAAPTCFFSFSAFAFLSPAFVFAATLAVLAASFASFSNLFASFLADDRSHKRLCRTGTPRIAPALLDVGVDPSTGGGLGAACSDDIVLANLRDLRAGGKRYRCSSRIQFRSSHRSPFCGHVAGCGSRSNRGMINFETRRQPNLVELSPLTLASPNIHNLSLGKHNPCCAKCLVMVCSRDQPTRLVSNPSMIITM